ncbi:MAG: hypothetical protein DHS20C15_11340 [Planctomycetota bacterium]|nr:MAG: hypothetical protein DHS20C15_11340 [Planctomycetota bacterium]
MNRPTTRKTPPGKRADLERVFTARGHALTKNPKNKYIAFEVRTDGRSIFTLYTSGKLVSTAREGDAEGLLLEASVGELLGEAPARAPTPVAAPRTGAAVGYFAGADETGTGEVLGTTILGLALLPIELQGEVARLVGHVETKSGRTDGGWERLGEQLAALRAQGLIVIARPVSNHLFDRYSKNALLDAAYLRLLADALAAAPDDLDERGLECIVDDYGVGAVLHDAQRAWAQRGRRLRLETKADRDHLAARAASVHARAARAREMVGARHEVHDGPIGTGNAGHRETRAWLRQRAKLGGAWPSFVKTSFRTVSELHSLEPVTKARTPRLEQLIPESAAIALRNGEAGALREGMLVGAAQPLKRLTWTPGKGFDAPAGAARALDFLPQLAGGLVIGEPAPSLELLDAVLQRDGGLAAYWRVLAGPEPDADDPAQLALAHAHRAGIIQWEPCAQRDPVKRARRHGAVLLRASGDGVELLLAP